MKAVMYLFLNRGLGMSKGKAAAQAAHAAVEAYRISKPEFISEWHKGKHYTKLVMLARNNEHLLSIERYLSERGIPSILIIDEGLTEIDPHQPTALGVAIVDKENPHIEATFQCFELYREKVKATLEIEQ